MVSHGTDDVAAKPRISEVMQETKVLLQQSRERLVITSVGSSPSARHLLTPCGYSRVAHDLSSCDTTKYKVSIVPSHSGNMRFHLGETIKVNWEAPVRRSRRDWIGIYRVSSFVFHPSSLMINYCRSVPISLHW